MEVILSVQGVALVGVVMAITSLVKHYIDSKWSPLVALVFGIAGAYLIPSVVMFGSTLLGGIVVGLTAGGLYSGSKSLLNK